MPTYQYVNLVSPLKGFEEPDTKSQSQGYVPIGKHLLKELRENYPNQDTDYACLDMPSLGDEETWICIRWKNRRYATVEAKTVQPATSRNFSQDEMAIKERFLVELLSHFHGFTYDLDQARYPFPLSGFKTPLAPPFTNNCCTFVEALVVKAWENAIEGFAWSRGQHHQMMIMSADDYYSPVTCLVDAEMAEPVVDTDDPPHCWSVVQGWRKQWTSGHTFIVLDHHADSDRVLTLESNSTYLLNGVGYRNIGNLKNFQSPQPEWWANDALWTWEKFKTIYRFRRQCILKVKDPDWLYV